MNSTFFLEYVGKIFPALQKVVDKINGGRQPLTYLFKTMLSNVYSADQKWESASVDTRHVAADVVSMDSPLPIKKRPTVAHSNGRLPKIGMKKIMGETDINTVNIMIAQGAQWEQVAKKLTADAVSCSTGIDEKIEYCFLYALGHGYCLIEEDNNTGTAMRADFGYLPENTYGVQVAGTIDYKSIQNVIAAASAKGDSITTIAVSLLTYNKMRQTNWAKELVANYRGISYASVSTLPTPSAGIFDEAFADDNNGIKFLKIDRSVIVEKDGKQKPVKPFGDDNLIFLTTENVGSLVWSNVAEKTNPVAGAIYSTLDQYKLVSKFSTPDPLQEVTYGQALVLPVIENVDQIYILDTTQGATDSQTEGDTTFAYGGKNYVKSEVIAAVNAVADFTISSNITDADLLVVLNLMSKAKRDAVFARISPSSSGSGSGSGSASGSN